MAIIQCPACTQRISNLSKTCPHCAADVLEARQNTTPLRRHLKHELYRMRMRGYVAASVFVLAIILWWVPTRGQLIAPDWWLQIMFVVGVLGQAVCRFFIIKIKRQLRALEDPDQARHN